jgi:hypothetical protein
MAKFKCNVCGGELELDKHTMKVMNGNVVSPEAMCCDQYMYSIRENKGFGGIIKRPGGTVRGKNGLTTK